MEIKCVFCSNSSLEEFIDLYSTSRHYACINCRRYQIVFECSNQIRYEIFTYNNKYRIGRHYQNGKIVKYDLYFPAQSFRESCITYNKDIDFDPLNPEKIINKLKTILVFS